MLLVFWHQQQRLMHSLSSTYILAKAYSHAAAQFVYDS